MAAAELSKWRSYFLWGTLFLYAIARVSQIYADRLPTLLIVGLHVVPPAMFALVHGAAVYRVRGMAVFTALCLGVGSLAESVGLRTGFPFGHYYFTEVMGPKVFQLPVLLALAYLGIGYTAWILALLILDYKNRPVIGTGIVMLPLLATFIMVAWDLSMEPDWSTLDHAWIWRDAGAYFGVPLSNFLGWLLTSYFYYQAFALFCSCRSIVAAASATWIWRPAILLYAICAFGNLLILKLPMAPPVVSDAAGNHWNTADILTSCVLVSLLGMTPFALLAWRRVRADSMGAIQR